MSRSARLGLVAATALASVAGLWNLGRESLWVDEAFSVAMARMGWADFAGLVVDREVNMVAYNLVLRGWVAIAGDSEATVRLPSVLFGVASVVLLFVLARRLYGPAVATLSCLFLALNGYFVIQMQEARAGTLVVLVTLVLTLVLLHALERPSTTRFVLYGAVAGVGAYVHFFLVLVVLAHVPLLIARRGELSPRSLVAGSAVLGVAWLPLGAFMLFGNHGHVDWIPPASLAEAWRVWFALSGRAGRLLAVVVLALVLIAGLAHLAHLRRRRTDGEPRGGALVWSMLVVPWLVVAAMSPFRSVMVPRYFLIVLPAVAILVAVGLISIPTRAMRLLAGLVLVGLSARGVALVHTGQLKEDWRGVVAHVVAEGAPADVLAPLAYWGRAPIDYYVARTGPSGVVVRPPRGQPPWGTWEGIARARWDWGLPAESLASSGTTWLVVRGGDELPRAVSAAIREREVVRHYFVRLELLEVRRR